VTSPTTRVWCWYVCWRS